MADYLKIAGSLPVASSDVVSADQTTIEGDGTALRPLRALGGLWPVSGGNGPAAFNLLAGKLNVTVGGGDATLPLAASVPNGTFCGVMIVDYSNDQTVIASGADVIHGGINIDNEAAALGYLSDGVAGWYCIVNIQ